MLYIHKKTVVAKQLEISEDEMNSILENLNITAVDDRLSREDLESLSRYFTNQKNIAEKESKKRETSAHNLMKDIAEKNLLILDTCAWLNKHLDALIGNLTPLLEASGQKILVPETVFRELYRLLSSDSVGKKAGKAIDIIRDMRQRDLVNIQGASAPDMKLADQELLVTVMGHFTSAPVAVVTFDRNLSDALLSINTQRSVQGFPVSVFRITKYGYLNKYHPQVEEKNPAVCTEPVCDNTLLPLTLPTQIGSVLFTENGQQSWKIVESLNHGGEGTLYLLDDGTAAKIYYPAKLTVMKRDKLALMVDRFPDLPTICRPLNLLFNENHEFVGFRMKHVLGMELSEVLLKEKLDKWSWTKMELISLSIRIFETIQALHNAGILVGDINLRNILVTECGDFSFVDCDSMQIQNFPSPVGDFKFTAPELVGKKLSAILRSEDNEYFSAAVLLFYILLPGVSPYTQTGGEEIHTLMQNGNFAFPFGEHNSPNTPPGMPRFQWSHLPRNVKRAFYETFHKDGRYHAGNRIPISRWLEMLSGYAHSIEDKSIFTIDPDALNIFPNSWKLFRKKIDENGTLEPLGIPLLCSQCGENFYISDEESLKFRMKGMSLPQRCPGCIAKRKFLIALLDDDKEA